MTNQSCTYQFVDFVNRFDVFVKKNKKKKKQIFLPDRRETPLNHQDFRCSLHDVSVMMLHVEMDPLFRKDQL